MRLQRKDKAAGDRAQYAALCMCEDSVPIVQ